MPNLNWDDLTPLQIGRYAEYYAKMEFASYGFEVYTSEVDDHGVDFIVKYKNTPFLEVQVKSLRAQNTANYTFILKTKMDIKDSSRIVCFLHFNNNALPTVYLIPATAWKEPNDVLVERNYDKPGQTSKPEWGIYFSKNAPDRLQGYEISQYIQKIKLRAKQ